MYENSAFLPGNRICNIEGIFTEEIMRYLGARWIRTSVGGSVSSLTNLPETSLPGAGTDIGSIVSSSGIGCYSYKLAF